LWRDEFAVGSFHLFGVVILSGLVELRQGAFGEVAPLDEAHSS
jgi:hypothetical protein